jgi:hypothetical protein
MDNPQPISWSAFATWYAKKGERNRTLPNAPFFLQRSPLPVNVNLVRMNTMDLREGGVGVEWIVEISLLDTLPWCV